MVRVSRTTLKVVSVRETRTEELGIKPAYLGCFAKDCRFKVRKEAGWAQLVSADTQPF